MSILSVDNISPIGSGTSVTVNSAATLVLTNANSTGVITATSFVGSGANLTGLPGGSTGLDVNDNVKIRLGTGNDLSLFHDGGNAYFTNISGTIHIQGKSGENSIRAIPDGAVELYHNNLKKFETNSSGAKVYGSLLVDSVLDISPPGNNAVLIKNPANGIIGFGANNQTNQVIITTDGHLGVTADSKELRLGASEDLKLFHDGTHSRITNSTGFLALQSDSFRLYNAAGSENMIDGTANGSVNLYYDNSKKFETTSSGATITGNLAFPSGNGIDFSATADGSGSGQYELLDDYEEGNWTPTVENGSGAFYVYSAKYTKIGRQVGIQFYMQLNNGAGNGNGVSIGGLPFAVRSNGWTCAKVSTGYNNSGVHCRAKAGTSAIDIKGPADQTVTFSNINGTWILSSFVYFTDS